MATLADVGRTAGVSKSVASRVLNGDPTLRTRPETRERVLAVAARMNYRPNFAARYLRTAQTGAIAMLLPDLNNPIFADMVRGAEAAADEAEVMVLLGRTERMDGPTPFLRRLIAEGRVDGLLLQRQDDAGHLDLPLVIGGLPVVLINGVGNEPGSVTLDDHAGARVATQHLIDLGHERIGFIGGSPLSFTSRRREEGFVQTLEDAGLAADPAHLVRFGYFFADGESALARLYEQDVAPPTAVVIASVNAGVGVMRAASTRGIEIPQQLSAIAIHDSPIVDYLARPLTTVRMPFFALGQEGVRLLLKRLENGTAEDAVVRHPAPEIIARGSTTAPARARPSRRGRGSKRPPE